MRTDEQLIQSALGDSAFSLGPDDTPDEKGLFNLYILSLPDTFKRGLPPVWHFAVLRGGIKPGQKNLSKKILEDARSIVASHPKDERPLVFLSDYPEVHLDDQLPQTQSRVFTLDHSELPGGGPRKALEPRLTPIVFAVRRRLDQQSSRMALCPYVRDMPAREWRFFGRRKELDRLVGSKENFMVIGARRIGKTSLLRQAKLELEKEGYDTVFVDAQTCVDERELTHAIMKEVSLRDFQALERRNQLTDERFLEMALKRLGGERKMTILIDELGNVISQMKSDGWRVIGTLRRFAQSGRIRIIGSAFQEFFLKQQEDFAGPFVNFAATLRLNGFRDAEIDDFVVNPLQVWAETPNPGQIRDTVLQAVGRHPMLLQYFCHAVYSTVARQTILNLMNGVSDVIGNQMTEVFSEPVEEIFYRMSSSVLRYIFLSACLDAEARQKPLHSMVLDDDWIEKALSAAGYASNTTSRRNLLEGLEVRGLTQPVGGDHSVQLIIAPIVFRLIKRTFTSRSDGKGLDRLLMKYRMEIDGEKDNWGLIRLAVPTGA
jgi:hypothetical protein